MEVNWENQECDTNPNFNDFRGSLFLLLTF